jgi:ABC-type branched-subunit amino acid transport system ATPase component
MAMLFETVLKGRIVEAQFTALLEQAGYSVRKMGVEALVEPVKRLSLEEYRRLGVPLPLRKMPDLLVMTSDECAA